MKSLKEKIEVMQAALDGKEIEFRPAETDHEWRILEDPLFGWGDYDYRIKQEPMEFWVDVWDNGHFCIHNDIETTPPGFKTIKVREVTEWEKWSTCRK